MRQVKRIVCPQKYYELHKVDQVHHMIDLSSSQITGAIAAIYFEVRNATIFQYQEGFIPSFMELDPWGSYVQEKQEERSEDGS